MTRSSGSSLPSTLDLAIYQTALAAWRVGISFIPIVADGTKRPAVRWKEYQRQLPSLAEARAWFYGQKRGIAFITGSVSGNLEMLDFDSREAYEEFAQQMQQEELSWLLDRIEQGYKEHSPHGVHLYYRCSFIEGNKKLAQRPLKVPPGVISKIETRGEGGYSIGAPSQGSVHPSGQPYQLLLGSLATIETIQPEERALLLSVARTLDEMPPAETSPKETSRSHKKSPGNDGRRLPGHIFNERATWPEILEPHGWTRTKSIGNEDFWCRPGKDNGISATTNYEGSDFLYVFSTSTLFEPRVGISKFAAYTFLEHNGDFSAAAKALAEQGYKEEEMYAPGRR